MLEGVLLLLNIIWLNHIPLLGYNELNKVNKKVNDMERKIKKLK